MDYKKYEMQRLYKYIHYLFKLFIIIFLIGVWFLILFGNSTLNNSLLDQIINYIVIIFINIISLYYFFRAPTSIIIKGDEIKYNLLFNLGVKYKMNNIYNYKISQNFVKEDLILLVIMNSKIKLLNTYTVLSRYYDKGDYYKFKEIITNLLNKDNRKTNNQGITDDIDLLKNILQRDKTKINNKIKIKLAFYLLLELPYFIIISYMKIRIMFILGFVIVLMQIYWIATRIVFKIEFNQNYLLLKTIINNYQLSSSDILIKSSRYFNNNVIIIVNNNFKFFKYFLIFTD